MEFLPAPLLHSKQENFQFFIVMPILISQLHPSFLVPTKSFILHTIKYFFQNQQILRTISFLPFLYFFNICISLRKVTIYLLTSCNTEERIAQNIYIHNSNRNYKKLTTTTQLIKKQIGIGYKNYESNAQDSSFA